MNVLKNDDLKNVPTAQTALGKLQERSLTQDAPSLFQPSQNMGFGQGVNEISTFNEALGAVNLSSLSAIENLIADESKLSHLKNNFIDSFNPTNNLNVQDSAKVWQQEESKIQSSAT